MLPELLARMLTFTLDWQTPKPSELSELNSESESDIVERRDKGKSKFKLYLLNKNRVKK